LDAGGGTGRISYSLRKWVSDVVIADSSLGMLTQAKKKNCLISVCSNTEVLPFADGTFECVIMVDALHHVYDYQVTIDELWRVVKPGGRIVIEEPNIETLPVKVLAIVEKLLLMRSHFISPKRIINAFLQANAGINIEKEGATAWIVVDKGSE
jgi:demethylmenaquinone methyltransferase/2-methoxy-6-polyprenyl-1,4-benzoquinol methylase